MWLRSRLVIKFSCRKMSLFSFLATGTNSRRPIFLEVHCSNSIKLQDREEAAHLFPEANRMIFLVNGCNLSHFIFSLSKDGLHCLDLCRILISELLSSSIFVKHLILDFCRVNDSILNVWMQRLLYQDFVDGDILEKNGNVPILLPSTLKS